MSSVYVFFSSSRKQFQSESDNEHQRKMSALEEKHQAKMREMRSNHEKTMSSIKIQSKLETEKHQEMMKRLKQQMETVENTGSLDILQFSGFIIIKTRHDGYSK